MDITLLSSLVDSGVYLGNKQ